MGLLTFKGGIHPDDGKRFSKDQAIRPITPKGDMVYPLSQHIGAPANPVVKKGDHVLKGQLIAEAGGFVSAPVYSSVSGTVKGLEQRFNPTGSKMECIVIENDGEYQEIEYEPVKPLGEMTREEILDRIGNAGIVGMGGAGFPTKVKLSPKEPDKIEYIIANCAECEPYITADYRRMLENTEELVSGMKVVLSLFPNAKGYFAVEDNKKDCAEKIRRAHRGRASHGCKTSYDEISAGRRTSADLCCNQACNQFLNASGRCRMYRRQCRDFDWHTYCGSRRETADGEGCHRKRRRNHVPR